jgi:hypothetical protein
MRLSELIEMLQDLATQCDAVNLDPNVEIHYQQNYPLRGRLCNVRAMVEEQNGDNPRVTVALAEGGHPYDKPYGSREAWEDAEDDVETMVEDFDNEEEDEDTL